jgi:hypothetical protein
MEISGTWFRDPKTHESIYDIKLIKNGYRSFFLPNDFMPEYGLNGYIQTDNADLYYSQFSSFYLTEDIDECYKTVMEEVKHEDEWEQQRKDEIEAAQFKEDCFRKLKEESDRKWELSRNKKGGKK